MELQDAIRISKILCYAPDERIPLILSALEKADVYIDGLEELEEWKTYKDMNAIVDLSEFMESFEDRFGNHLIDGKYRVPTAEFKEFCREHKLKPTSVRRWMARRGIIQAARSGEKINYTIPERIGGKIMRCVVVKEDWRNMAHSEKCE